MKWTVFAMILALALFAPSLKAQTSDHIEVGAFVDYFNLSRTDPNTNYVGVGNLERYNVRFTKQTWPGEVLTTHVKVEKKYTEGQEHRVDLECSVTNEAGEPKLTGVATAALPQRG